MIKKTIKFVDYNGKQREEEHFFNLTKPELVAMQTSMPGGKSRHFEKLVAEESGVELMKEFGEIILKSYGEKTPDGRFEKSKEIRERFESSAAYETLFMELLMNEAAAVAFMKGVLPTDLPV